MIPLGALGSAHVPAASSGWTPADLTLYGWFDAADAGTITTGTGGVSQWADKSGNGYHVSQSEVAFRPDTGVRTINSLNVLDFNTASGVEGDGLMSSTSLTLPVPLTVGVVFQFDAIRIDGSVIVALSSLGGYAPGALSNPNPDQWWIKQSANIQGDGGGAPGTGVTYCAVTVLNGSSSLLRINGTQRLSGNAGTGGGNRIGISTAGLNAKSYGINGAIGEVVVASGALTGSDLSNLESYLMDKWGI